MKHELHTVESFRHQFKPALTKNMVYRMIEDKTIKAIRPKNKLYIPASEVDKFLEIDSDLLAR